MDTATLIWIIVGVIVVAIIVVVALALTARGRAEKKRQAEHEKAEKIRAEARETELAARESEARAAKSRADAASAAAAAQQAQAQAAQADVDARRLADTVSEHDAEAAKHRAEQEERLRKADDVDPYVTTDGDDRDGDGRVDRNRDGSDVREERTVVRDDRDAAVSPAATRSDRSDVHDGVPPAPDGVVGRDASTHDTTGQDPAITRPPSTAADARVDDGDDGVPPATRRDRA
ncbi:hypothetical protein [Microbacterium flavescens]|jgi:FtsZ-interacting cell division protein ZipA|uniref:hypothetical protein n=1 Tax=Microbacterium flavescens TaxID=69366 RepID=UPI001BDE7876|nr:hypothetical protein [Microbacterium flavescens]